MEDLSPLDEKYFIDNSTFNCPFCNRRNVKFHNLGFNAFDWSEERKCAIWLIKCTSCNRISMHLTHENLQNPESANWNFKDDVDLDGAIFFSVPSSFFNMDSRVPERLRNLITEAEGCLRMNYRTAAALCVKLAVGELLESEVAEASGIKKRLRVLRERYPNISAELWEVIGQIQCLTTPEALNHSLDACDNKHLRLYIETLKVLAYEMYVAPKEQERRVKGVRKLMQEIVTVPAAAPATPPPE